MPAFNPFRVLNDPALVEMLRRYSTGGRKVYIMAHFNHPRELTEAAIDGLARLQEAGVTTLNQSPLIRGVNDDPELLSELFRRLSDSGVVPYYIFICRPTAGNAPFVLPIEEALEIFDQSRRNLSGLARHARLCMSHKTGKVEVVGKVGSRILFRYHQGGGSAGHGSVSCCSRAIHRPAGWTTTPAVPEPWTIWSWCKRDRHRGRSLSQGSRINAEEMKDRRLGRRWPMMPGEKLTELMPEDAGRPAAGEDIWSAELEQAHRDLSELDLRFRRYAMCTPDLLRGRSYENMIHRAQAWPTFIGAAKLAELKRASLGACNLLRGIPGRFYRFDPARAVAIYQVPSASELELLLSPPNGSEAFASRGDFIFTRQGFKCIEFNFTANLGGWEAGVLAEHLRGVPALASFLAEQQETLAFTDPIARFFHHILDTAGAEVLAEGSLNVAFVTSTLAQDELATRPGSELTGRALRAAAAAGAGFSTAVHFCRYEDLASLHDRAYYGKTRIHAIVELDTNGTPPAIYRTFKRGGVMIFDGLLAPLVTTKLNLALAWELAAAWLLTDDEERVLAEFFPWTRQVLPGTVGFRGEQVAFAELLARGREQLVLKQEDSFGGKGVWLGRDTSAADWESLSRHALAEGSWVAQEVLETACRISSSAVSRGATSTT